MRGSKPGERRGGRKAGVPNKATAEIKELARKHGPELIKAAVALAKGAESETARIAAINLVLDRGYGKAAQPLTGEDGEGAVKLQVDVSDQNRARALAAFLAKTKAGKG